MTTATMPGTHRPASAYATATVLTFLGLSATGGGLALAAGQAAPPENWLANIPLIDSWIVPGLVLGVGFGLGSLLTAYGIMFRPRWRWLRPLERLTRHHWSWAAALAIGAGHAVWIGLELIYLPELSMLQAIYGAVAVALLILPALTSLRHYLR